MHTGLGRPPLLLGQSFNAKMAFLGVSAHQLQLSRPLRAALPTVTAARRVCLRMRTRTGTCTNSTGTATSTPAHQHTAARPAARPASRAQDQLRAQGVKMQEILEPAYKAGPKQAGPGLTALFLNTDLRMAKRRGDAALADGKPWWVTACVLLRIAN